MTLLQIGEVADVARTTDFTVVGVMAVVIIGLAWFIRYLLKRDEAKDAALMDVTEKYFKVSTELVNLIKNKRNV